MTPDEAARLRKDAADAAALRNAFYVATAAFWKDGRPVGLMPEPVAAVWKQLYTAVRDTQAGLGLLAELERLRARVAELEAEK